MEDENFDWDEIEDDDDFEPWESFGESMNIALSPLVKKFLNDYYGEMMYNLQADTYREIDNVISEGFMLGDELLEIMFRHRTITDMEKVDEAFNNFKPSAFDFKWRESKKSFIDPLDEEDDRSSEDGFLDDVDPEELTDDQKKAKIVVGLVDEILDEDRRFNHFLQAGYDFLIRETQLFIEKEALFDLFILSAEGAEELQNNMDFVITSLLEDLDSVLYEEIHR